MKTAPYYEEVRTITPDLGEFTITGDYEAVELALKSFGRLKEVPASTFDRAAEGKPVRQPLNMRTVATRTAECRPSLTPPQVRPLLKHSYVDELYLLG
jgi:hypothetical protein